MDVNVDPHLFVDTDEIKVIAAGGKHIIIDMLIEATDKLASVEFLEKTLISAAEASGATILFSKFHHFGEGYGVTGVLLLAESHITIHTWPEDGYAAIDVFMCGQCDPYKTFAVFDNAFNPDVIEFKTADRVVPAGPKKLLN